MSRDDIYRQWSEEYENKKKDLLKTYNRRWSRTYKCESIMRLNRWYEEQKDQLTKDMMAKLIRLFEQTAE